jgi:2',3'-cyclic-nucleotide 2'-phosphodiesterase (5'-nucleotidase family)
MKKTLLYSLLLLLLAGCSRPLVPAQYSYAERRITDSVAHGDPKVEALIKPYRDSMQAEMNEVLVINDAVLTKQMPESDLGNLLAGILLEKSQSYIHKKVDVAMINFGGIRIGQLGKGPVTREKAFELMPFDNMVVVMDLDGKTTKELFDRMAGAGGVPVAGATYAIDEFKKAQLITIQGAPFDINKTYTIALSDYLANGGEKLDMLVGKPQIATGKLLRDAFIEGFKEINARGEHLKSIKDGRVKLISK